MKNFTFVLFLFSVLLACKKKNQDPCTAIPDNIIFTELDTTSISSVDHYIDTVSNCLIPVPIDSSCALHLDLNLDGINDFTLRIMHSPVQWLANCPMMMYRIQITSTSDSNEVAMRQPLGIGKNFSFNDEISETIQDWNNGAALYVESIPDTTIQLVGTQFYGLRVKNGKNTNYGWVKLRNTEFNLTLLEYAYNETPNKKIRAGQKN